jgi:hypothetical protein
MAGLVPPGEINAKGHGPAASSSTAAQMHASLHFDSQPIERNSNGGGRAYAFLKCLFVRNNQYALEMVGRSS